MKLEKLEIIRRNKLEGVLNAFNPIKVLMMYQKVYLYIIKIVLIFLLMIYSNQ